MTAPGTAAFCLRLLRRQLVLAVRRPIEIANPLLFFAMVVALFPLGLGPAPDSLAEFAPGILWIIALLSNLLTSDTVFRSDYDDGSLEQLLLSPQPLFLSVLAYVGAHWLVTGMLLAVVSPVFALMLGLPGQALGALFLSLLIGTAVLSLVGGIGAALTVGLKRGGMLISLLILPLYMPVLIFGSAAVQAAVSGAPAVPYLAILGAMLSLAIALAPIAIAAGLRISIDA
ncbi:heme exporter protein CcmB [Halioglobus japonicus]|uniref:Heme exporter protein B n=1 Tax=Halioglobus japonicus TaxID=930805 RepID=A0AAP8MG26_9GAMM|nr:heme exporter protein CcmB [Halioglobus japonicus]AQA18811.1 heme exporter protein CcmB [Halioglobus japonicus]PLW86842.1 heme exporter protein CcmB [Halioglobus japonicus]GHD23768.1 heme exporter protein B [Halioglobus japonicus]